MATANNIQDLQKIIATNAAALKNVKQGYDTMYQNYANQLVNNGSFQAIESARQNMQNNTNRQYNDAAKNYYAQYRINQNKLPEQLSNLGVTGGASETAQLGLMNQYSGNLYNNESARANALNTGNMQYDQMVAENSTSLAEQLANTYLTLAQQAREELLAEQAAKAAASSSRGGGGRSSRRSYRSYYKGGSGSSSTGVKPSGGKTSVSDAIKNGANLTALIGANALKNAGKGKKKTIENTAKYKETYGSTKKTTKKKKTGGSGGGTSKARTYKVSMYK